MAKTVYGDSIHSFSSFMSSASSQSMDGFTTEDGLYRTYNITLDADAENNNISILLNFSYFSHPLLLHPSSRTQEFHLNPKTVYPGDNVTTYWSASTENLTTTKWTNRIFVVPGIYGVGNGSTSYDFARTVPTDMFTRVGFHLFLNGPLWSFGDVVWKNTEIWVEGARNHDWCDK